MELQNKLKKPPSAAPGLHRQGPGAEHPQAHELGGQGRGGRPQRPSPPSAPPCARSWTSREQYV